MTSPTAAPTRASHPTGSKPGPSTSGSGKPNMPRRAALSAFLGSLVEYYDFFLFGTASALVFGPLFYGPLGETGALLASFATFGVAYAARPLGAILFGALGDKIGRKTSLIWCLIVMGVATFSIGLLPTADSIGLLAPALLVTLRCLQGLSAGGEQAGSNTLSMEHAPDGRRGLFTSWSMQGTVAGMMLGNLAFILASSMPSEVFLSWGWRVPFLLAAPLMVVSLIVRRLVAETESFTGTVRVGAQARVPLFTVLRDHRGAFIRVVLINLLSVSSTTVAVYGLSVWTTQGNQPASIYLTIMLATNVLLLLTQPLWAHLSDRIGRRPILIGALVALAILWVPFFMGVASGSLTGVILAQTSFAVLYSAANAVQASFYAEQFPARVRYTGMAVGMQLGILLSGFAPAIYALISGAAGTPLWLFPALFASFTCLIAAGATFASRETSRVSTSELDR